MSQENPKKNTPKKKRVAKKAKPKEPVEPAPKEISKESSREEREKSLKSILEQFSNAEKSNSHTDPKMLAAVLEEYLSCYILIGYDTKGDPIAFTSTNKQIEVDALNTSLHRFLTTYGLFGPPPPPDAGQEE